MLEANIGLPIGQRRSLQLTGREREVLGLVERGLTNAEIARRMRIARPTVVRLLSNAMARLGAESRAHAVVLASPAEGRRSIPRHDAGADEEDGLRFARARADVGLEARALMGRIAAGETLGQAARALHLSRRTADRRLARARHALGAERTVVAVVRARGLGWLD